MNEDQTPIKESPKLESVNENNDTPLDTCEVLDKDAYGDILQNETTTAEIENLPTFTVIKGDTTQDDKNIIQAAETNTTSEGNIHTSSERNQKCDLIESRKKEFEENVDMEGSEETDSNPKLIESNDESKASEEYLELNGRESPPSLNPSTLINTNANSAFEISTFYV